MVGLQPVALGHLVYRRTRTRALRYDPRLDLVRRLAMRLRLLRRVVRTSNVLSMEKLLVAHPWNVDHRSGSGNNVGAEQRLLEFENKVGLA